MYTHTQSHTCKAYFPMRMVQRVNRSCIYIGNPVDEKIQLKSETSIIKEESGLDSLLGNMNPNFQFVILVS